MVAMISFGGVHAGFLRADELLVIFAADDDAAHLHAVTLRQRIQGFDDQRPVGWRVPLDQDELRIDLRSLQLADEKARRPPDSQIKIAGITVVAEVGDETDVWPGGVHVELLK
jgi:hypothetical protein